MQYPLRDVTKLPNNRTKLNNMYVTALAHDDFFCLFYSLDGLSGWSVSVFIPIQRQYVPYLLYFVENRKQQGAEKCV